MREDISTYKGAFDGGSYYCYSYVCTPSVECCEPMLPDESNRETVASPLDSTKNDLDINEWETDTTTYQSHAKPV